MPTTKCPHCGHVLEKSPYAKEVIGPPRVRCPACRGIIYTLMKFWPDMSPSEKTWYLLRMIVLVPWTILVRTFMLLFLPYLALEVIGRADTFLERHSFAVGCYVIIVVLGLSSYFIYGAIERTRRRATGTEIPYWK